MTRALSAALLALVAWSPARAGAAPWVVQLPSEGLDVEVRYTSGVHHERVRRVEGTLDLREGDLALTGGDLAFPLAAFTSDDPKRGCHLREALGLDYARSRFPGEHVCDDHNRLPTNGPDSIAYPEILLRLGAAPGPAAQGPRAIDVPATLTLHGVSRALTLRLNVARVAARTLHVHGDVPIHLSDFGVQVKPAKVLLFTISVKDEATLHIDVQVEPAPS